MKLQYLCHLPAVLIGMGFAAAGAAAQPAPGPSAPHDYPTLARVEYVNQCVAGNGGKLAALYQCTCAIDWIAAVLAYDDYVEATTFVQNANMPGAGGGMFRDSERGRHLTDRYRALEEAALRSCGMTR